MFMTEPCVGNGMEKVWAESLNSLTRQRHCCGRLPANSQQTPNWRQFEMCPPETLVHYVKKGFLCLFKLRESQQMCDQKHMKKKYLNALKGKCTKSNFS